MCYLVYQSTVLWVTNGLFSVPVNIIVLPMGYFVCQSTLLCVINMLLSVTVNIIVCISRLLSVPVNILCVTNMLLSVPVNIIAVFSIKSYCIPFPVLRISVLFRHLFQGRYRTYLRVKICFLWTKTAMSVLFIWYSIHTLFASVYILGSISICFP